MIIIKLQGGLGNQLFQYAFGRFLEETCRKEVAYDDTFFRVPHRFTKRAYMLNLFSTKVRIATDKELRKVKYPYGVLSVCFYYAKKAINSIFLKRYRIGYDEEEISMIRKKSSAHLEGWWQTYRYADAVADGLRKEIRMKGGEGGMYSRYAGMIEGVDSVFVHIRRGDYLKGGTELQVLQEEYYVRAQAHLKKNIGAPSYFIFSDDGAWARKHMRDIFPDSTVVDDPELSDEESFMLMSACRHAVIANSSFSWWAAYLTDREDKIVITPKKWQNINMPNTDDLCPSRWVRI